MIPRPHALRRPVVAALLGLALSACGGEATEVPAAATSTSETPAQAPAAPSTPPERAIAGRSRSLPGWSESLRRRVEPDAADTPLEAAAESIEVSCARWVEALLAGEEVDAPPTAGLFPMALEPRFEARGTSVLRAGESAEELAGTALRARVREEPWSTLGGGEASVTVEAIEREGDAWRADLRLRVVARAGEAKSQLNARWSGTFAGGEPRSLRGLSHELVRLTRPAFQDITLDVFGDLPGWDTELALGCDAYHQRTDQRVDFFYVGILGLAIGDANGDGLEDLYLSQLGGLPNRLLLHQSDGTVEDGGRAAGVDFLDTTRGALFVDLDDDGDQDLAVAREADLVLCWNDGEGKFSRREVIENPGRSPIYSLSAADADGDGDLDLYGCRYPSSDISGGVPTPYHDARNGVRNVLWRNLGGGGFEDATEAMGLAASDERFSYVSLWEDLDGDDQLDLYVVNDYGANQAFVRAAEGFREATAELGLEDVAAGMGISAADVDQDGDLDLYVSNMYSEIGRRVTRREGYRAGGSEGVRAMHLQHASGNALFLREAAGYREVAAEAGCAPGGWAWGAIFHDWNADGLPDIVVPNGFITGSDTSDVEGLFWREVIGSTPDVFGPAEDYKRGWAAVGHFSQFDTLSWNGHERNFAYLNLGGGEFADASGATGLDFSDDGRVAARLDWDGDGVLDLLLVNRSGPRLRLLRGTDAAPAITLELVGAASMRDAVGALVRLERSDGVVLTQRVYAGEGLVGQSSRRLCFGLAEATGTASAQVRWPDGETRELRELQPGGTYRVVRGEAEVQRREVATSPFAGRAPSPAARPRGAAPRLVLADKLPLAQLSFPRAGAGRLAIHELAGSPIALTYVDAGASRSRALLEGLAQEQDALRKAGAKVVPVLLEAKAPDLRWLEQRGLAERAVRASAGEERVLQALLIEVLGAYHDIELPFTLILDGGGNLAALHFAESDAARIVRDLRKARYMNPEDPSTTALSGGRWLRRPRRQLEELSAVLQMLGARDLSRALGELAKSR